MAREFHTFFLNRDTVWSAEAPIIQRCKFSSPLRARKLWPVKIADYGRKSELAPMRRSIETATRRSDCGIPQMIPSSRFSADG